ncbi:MAG TPA: deoxyribodipyrimidine photo-lyase [Terriglobales bacterium]|nr:deoxyribodipyrimidine photo-lyase [Terriglobales bacterium]
MNNLDKLADHPRARIRSGGLPDPEGRCVVFWMQRSQRGVDNPALDVAVEAANALAKPVVVFFAPVPFYPNANLRHYEFLAEGIPDIAATLEQRGVGFVLRRYPEHSLLKFCDEVRPALVVGDENPMRQPSHWREVAASKLRVPFWTVDSDVIVPSRLIEKEQYAAHIIRKKLHAQVDRYLVRPKNPRPNIAWKKPRGLQSLLPDFDILQGWELDRSVSPVRTFRGGTAEGMRLLRQFVKKKLSRYAAQRNHPEIDGTSQLSPYLHFGHISPLTVVLAVREADAPASAKEAFLNQLLVWRELSINFVTYNPNYDNFESGENWAHRTLAKHASDPRPVVYSERQMENAETHDPLWNAAQRQMVSTGWMHNYVRMYWAKKILEWSRTPAEAFRVAVALNDKYELDGRDPNGYAGIAWSIMGKFDRPWFERPIFGQIRYMSGASTGKKFDSRRYIEQQSKPPRL